MEQNKVAAIIVVVIIVGGAAILFLPSLLTPTEYRFAEGESGRISIDVRGITNCDIIFTFVDEQELKFRYEQVAGPEGGTVVVTTQDHIRYDFRDTVDGLTNVTSLIFTLGSSAHYWIVLDGPALDVDIHYNEYSVVQEGIWMESTGGRLNLTIDSDADVGGAFEVTTLQLGSANIDLSIPDGAKGDFRPVSNEVSIITNNGWAFSGGSYEKGSGTLLYIEIRASGRIGAWLR